MDLSGNQEPPREYVYIRYDFQHALERFILNMKGEKEEEGQEIKAGAIDLLSFMYKYLHRRYFEYHEEIHISDVINAIEDAHNEVLEQFNYVEYRVETPIDVEHELDDNHPE